MNCLKTAPFVIAVLLITSWQPGIGSLTAFALAISEEYLVIEISRGWVYGGPFEADFVVSQITFPVVRSNSLRKFRNVLWKTKRVTRLQSRRPYRTEYLWYQARLIRIGAKTSVANTLLIKWLPAKFRSRRRTLTTLSRSLYLPHNLSFPLKHRGRLQKKSETFFFIFSQINANITCPCMVWRRAPRNQTSVPKRYCLLASNVYTIKKNTKIRKWFTRFSPMI